MNQPAPVFDLRIGTKYYQVASSDQYLRQARTGRTRKLGNLARKAFGRDGWEPRMTRLFGALIKPDHRVIDVGANIGCAALLFSDLARQVVAFEPLDATYRLLRQNIEMSGKTNIRSIHSALGDEAKQAEIYFSDANRSMAFVLDRTLRDDSTTTGISVQTLDDVFASLALDRLDFMKIDVEGYEPRVLKGAVATIAAQQPVVQLEFNAWCLDVQQRVCLPDFIDLVQSIFPLVYSVDKDHYIDLGSTEGRYDAMAQCMIKGRYKELVCAFREDQVADFKRQFIRKPDHRL